MASYQWQQLALSMSSDNAAWELFHENSKLTRSPIGLSDKEIRDYVNQLQESLSFDGLPIVNLPKHIPVLNIRLDDAIVSRTSFRDFSGQAVTLKDLAALLYFGYGLTHRSAVPGLERSCRVVPSGGGLYPLEIFVFVSRVKGLPCGLYHYNPCQHHFRLLLERDLRQELSQSLVQASIAQGASAFIFLTALFERSIFKYGERGYRFILLEAGHVAQNMNLASNALKLGCLNIGGFFDRDVDALLRLDGITHSTIYILAVGTKHNRSSHQRKSKRRA